MSTGKGRKRPKAKGGRLQAAARALEQVKQRPLVVILVLLATASLGALKWANEIIDTGKSLGEKTGLLQSADERSEEQLAYQLGKVVAWRSFYVTQNGSPLPKSEEPADIRVSVANNLAELRSICKKLDIPIDPQDQDFSSDLLGDYQQSPAAAFYASSLGIKHRAAVAAAFQLGLGIEGSFWMAQRRKFEYSELATGFSAVLTLAALNAKAQSLGAKPVPVVGLDTDEVVALNREMQELLRQLDHNASDKL